MPPVNATTGLITHNAGKVLFIQAFLQQDFAPVLGPLIIDGTALRGDANSPTRQETMSQIDTYIRNRGQINAAPNQRPFDLVVLEANLGNTGGEALSFEQGFFENFPNTRFVLFSQAVTPQTIADAHLPGNVIFNFNDPLDPNKLDVMRTAYVAQIGQVPRARPQGPVDPEPMDPRVDLNGRPVTNPGDGGDDPHVDDPDHVPVEPVEPV
ncbi:hypothetical protein JYJ95_12995 [Corallococcus exiguus]|uniref:hypothetical protein n=1 Tax=Corallococcus exiguus TaxID=83462 RepID=UPI001A8C0E19|nr:hypothetical protein [Corallococcus exiguus]MBN8467433.1 hypothetical protein [Corallococcus exiguus]